MKHPVGPQDHSALAFERVVTREAVFIDLDAEYEPVQPIESGDLEMKLEVRITMAEAGQRAYVLLRGSVDCPPGKSSFAKLAAAVEGVFSVRDGNTERLGDFARLQAPVLLLPYLRSVLTDLTAMTRMGAFVLPPLNMMSLVERMAEHSAEPQSARS